MFSQLSEFTASNEIFLKYLNSTELIKQHAFQYVEVYTSLFFYFNQSCLTHLHLFLSHPLENWQLIDAASYRYLCSPSLPISLYNTYRIKVRAFIWSWWNNKPFRPQPCLQWTTGKRRITVVLKGSWVQI